MKKLRLKFWLFIHEASARLHDLSWQRIAGGGSGTSGASMKSPNHIRVKRLLRNSTTSTTSTTKSCLEPRRESALFKEIGVSIPIVDRPTIKIDMKPNPHPLANPFAPLANPHTVQVNAAASAILARFYGFVPGKLHAASEANHRRTSSEQRKTPPETDGVQGKKVT